MFYRETFDEWRNVIKCLSIKHCKFTAHFNFVTAILCLSYSSAANILGTTYSYGYLYEYIKNYGFGGVSWIVLLVCVQCSGLCAAAAAADARDPRGARRGPVPPGEPAVRAREARPPQLHRRQYAPSHAFSRALACSVHCTVYRITRVLYAPEFETLISLSDSHNYNTVTSNVQSTMY